MKISDLRQCYLYEKQVSGKIHFMYKNAMLFGNVLMF